MKISKPRKKKSPIIIISIVIVLLLIGGYFAYAKYLAPHKKSTQENSQNVNKIDYNPPTSAQTNPTSDNTSSATTSSQKNDTSAPNSSTGSSSNSLNVTITSKAQNGTTLQIRALITPLTQSGTCTLTLSATGQQQIVKTAPVQALASVSTCQGFDIDTTNMQKGLWHIALSVSAGSLQSNQASDEVTLQ